MKIKHLLNESSEELFEKIINSKFFKDNYEEKVRYAVEEGIDFHYIDEIVWLFHASSKLDKEGGIMSQKLREAPRDTNRLFHDIVNQVSNETLGVPVRNLMFSYTTKYKTMDYGNNYYALFPLSDDYQLFYGDLIDDMTSHYSVSVFSEDSLKNIIKKFSEKHNLANLKVNGRIDDNTIRFNNISSYDELYEFSQSMFKEPYEDYSEEELSKMFSSFVKEVFIKRAQHYVGRIKETQRLSKRAEEYMLKSDTILYLPVSEASTSLGEFRRFLFKKYS